MDLEAPEGRADGEQNLLHLRIPAVKVSFFVSCVEPTQSHLPRCNLSLDVREAPGAC